MRLTNQGLAAIDAAFLEGQPRFLLERPSYVTALQGHALISRNELAIDVPESTGVGPDDDLEVASALHERLPIRRAVATDTRFWAWLAACHYADVIRRRWSASGRPPHWKRFRGSLIENGLARLWWAAELTSDERGVDARSLSSLLSSQYRTDRLLSMAVLRDSVTLRGFLDAIGDDTRWQILNATCQRLGLLATTHSVASMTREEVRDFVARIYADISHE